MHLPMHKIRATPPSLPNHLICSADQCKGSLPQTLPPLPNLYCYALRILTVALRICCPLIPDMMMMMMNMINIMTRHTSLLYAVPEQTDDSTEGGERQQTEDIRAGFCYHCNHFYLQYLRADFCKSKLSSNGYKNPSHVAVFTFHILTAEDLNHILFLL